VDPDRSVLIVIYVSRWPSGTMLRAGFLFSVRIEQFQVKPGSEVRLINCFSRLGCARIIRNRSGGICRRTARLWAASKAPFYSSLRRRRWSRTTCPPHLDAVVLVNGKDCRGGGSPLSTQRHPALAAQAHGPVNSETASSHQELLGPINCDG
jgi:hypothetical protein